MQVADSNQNKNEIYCIFCPKSMLRTAFSTKDRNRRVDDRIFTVMTCPFCGLGYTYPRLNLEELTHYYPLEYFSIDDNQKIEGIKHSRRYRQVRIARIKKYFSSGLLLDVGAGTGMFLKTAKENHYDVEGLEISKNAAQFGRSAWGLTIKEGDFENTSYPMNHYDIVTLGHVLEHLNDPICAIRKLYSILKPNGLLVISVPNINSIQSILFRNKWFHLDIPRHLYHYSPSVLSSILDSAGFKIVEINYYSSEHNWVGILGSIMRLSPPDEFLLHKIVRKLIGSPIARTLAFLEALIRRGGTFELYAIKK